MECQGKMKRFPGHLEPQQGSKLYSAFRALCGRAFTGDHEELDSEGFLITLIDNNELADAVLQVDGTSSGMKTSPPRWNKGLARVLGSC